MGFLKKMIVDPVKQMEDGLQKEINTQHRLALKTANAIRKVVLIPTAQEQQTELDDFHAGQIDPQMQLLLIARNEFVSAEDPTAKLGFYKAMRDVFQSMDTRTKEIMELAMRERHHKDKLELLARAKGVLEPTEAEIESAIASEPDEGAKE